MKNEAKEIFRDILIYMHDRYHAFPIPVGLSVIQKGFTLHIYICVYILYLYFIYYMFIFYIVFMCLIL